MLLRRESRAVTLEFSDSRLYIDLRFLHIKVDSDYCNHVRWICGLPAFLQCMPVNYYTADNMDSADCSHPQLHDGMRDRIRRQSDFAIVIANARPGSVHM